MGAYGKRIRWLFGLGITVGILLGLTTIGFSQDVVRLTNGEWPPFTSKKLKHYGVYSHIVSKAFAIEGVRVEYGFFPWARSYHYARNGTWDGSVTWAPTPEKKADVLFSDPVILHTKVFFHLKEFPFDWASLKDLKGLRIGATKEYTYGDEFDRAAKKGNISVEFVPRDIQNLKKLLGGRFDVFPSDIDVGYDLLNANFIPADISRVTHHPKPIQQTGTCVILTKSAPEKSQFLLERFNRGLKKLKVNGEYHRMLEASRRGAYQPK